MCCVVGCPPPPPPRTKPEPGSLGHCFFKGRKKKKKKKKKRKKKGDNTTVSLELYGALHPQCERVKISMAGPDPIVCGWGPM